MNDNEREVYHRLKSRDILMKNMITHYFRKNFELALMAFKNNASNEKKKAKRVILFEVEMQVDEQQNYINKNQEEAFK